MSCWSVHTLDFSRQKSHERFRTSAVFPAKIERISRPTNMFCLITHLQSKRATMSRNVLISSKFEAQTLTGNATGNSRCYALESLDFNKLYSFGQSARPIKSRCVVNWFSFRDGSGCVTCVFVMPLMAVRFSSEMDNGSVFILMYYINYNLECRIH